MSSCGQRSRLTVGGNCDSTIANAIIGHIGEVGDGFRAEGMEGTWSPVIIASSRSEGVVVESTSSHRGGGQGRRHCYLLLDMNLPKWWSQRRQERAEGYEEDDYGWKMDGKIR